MVHSSMNDGGWANVSWCLFCVYHEQDKEKAGRLYYLISNNADQGISLLQNPILFSH